MDRTLCHFACLILILASVSNAWSREPRPDSVILFDTEGRSSSGQLTALSAEGVTLSQEESRTWDTADVWKLEFGERRTPRQRTGPVILLANGDRIAATPRKAAEGALLAGWQAGHEQAVVRIPLETVRGVIFRRPPADASRRRLVQTVLERDRTDDVVLLANGDRFAGEWLGLTEESLRFKTSVGETQLNRQDIQAVAFNPLLTSFPEVTGPRVLLTLTDGSRITGKNARLNDGRLTVDALFGAPLEIPLSALVSLRFLGGPLTYLSDLEPAESRFTPYLSGDWPLERDRNVLGGPLRLRGTEYPKGLGMHSRSAVSYDLGGRYRTFRSVIGLDDAAGGKGGAVFAVEVDGTRRFASRPLTPDDPPLTLPPIDVSGADRLTLVVDFGPWGDVMDRADWCDAVLVE